MSNRLVLFALLAIGAIVAGLLWAVGGGFEGETARPPAVVTLAEPAEAPPPQAPAGHAPADEDLPGRERAAERAPVGRTSAALREEELSEAHWIEGVVVFPEGTPPDEEVTLVASGRAFADGAHHRVRVGPDGAFRLAFAARTLRGRIELEARYLFLRPAPSIKVREHAEHLVLEPELGGVLAGEVFLPQDSLVAPDALVGQTVHLTGHDSTTFDRRQFQLPLQADLAFEFRGLPDGNYNLWLDSEEFERFHATALVTPGEAARLDVALARGGVVAGRVVDADAVPLADVRVSVQGTHERGRGWGRSLVTGADGEFRLGGVGAGEARLHARAQGFVEVDRSLGEVGRDRALEGLELVLERGESIAGRVTWPDGTPAEGAVVRVEPMQGEDSLRFEWRTDEEGAFEVQGLEPGPYRLDAQAVSVEEVVETSKVTGKERTRKRRSTKRAALEDVAAGARDVTLVLGTGSTLAGRVVDDRGQPVGDFRIEAERSEASQKLSRSFRNANGAFVLEGVPPGEWDLRATAKEHAESKPIRVVTPPSDGVSPEVELLVRRHARVAGVVLSRDGQPVADADVDVVVGLGEGGRSHKRVSTNADGVFVVPDVRPGTMGLRASAEGHAPSEDHPLEVVPGSEHVDVQLRLRTGATITGEVLGPDGVGLPDRSVSVRNWEKQHDLTVKTDARGHFRAEHLPPGQFQVAAPASREEILDLLGPDAEESASRLFERTEYVQVADEEELHVVLTLPQMEPVLLSGTVRVNGEPLRSAFVSAYELELRTSVPGVQTDAQGAFDLALPRSGSFLLVVNDWRSGMHHRQSLDVAGVERLEVDVDLRTGRIAGTVTDLQGVPLEGLQVRAELERDARDEGVQSAGAGAETDANGAYRMELVPVGRYRVVAGEPGQGHQHEAAPSSHSLGVAEEVEVLEGAESRTDFGLGAGGSVAGRVLGPDGRPYPGAWVRIVGARGPMKMQSAASDASGRFRIEGLPPGPFTLEAIDEELLSAPAEAHVRAGEEDEIELTLSAGSQLWVFVRNDAEELLKGRLELEGPGARNVPMYFMPDRKWVVGPVLPGTYTLRVHHELGTVSQEVVVTGERRIQHVGLRLH
jgi:protocatechuate 3,4-dioxygenase beta subunit